MSLTLWDSVIGICWLCVTLCMFQFYNHLDGEERDSCFSEFVFLMCRDCCVALPGGAMGLSAVCECGIS